MLHDYLSGSLTVLSSFPTLSYCGGRGRASTRPRAAGQREKPGVPRLGPPGGESVNWLLRRKAR